LRWPRNIIRDFPLGVCKFCVNNSGRVVGMRVPTGQISSPVGIIQLIPTESVLIPKYWFHGRKLSLAAKVIGLIESPASERARTFHFPLYQGNIKLLTSDFNRFIFMES
jgi:hypothetical protein